MTSVSFSVYVGGCIIFGPMGACYNQPPRVVFSSDANVSFENLKRLIYQHSGLMENQCALNIQGKWNTGDDDNVWFSPIPIFDDRRLQGAIDQAVRCKFSSMVELFVEIVPHPSGDAHVPTGDSLTESRDKGLRFSILQCRISFQNMAALFRTSRNN